MTLTTTTTKDTYDGDGSTVSFPVTFPYWDSTDIKVIHRGTTGTETTWVDGTQYTIAGGDGSTGTVTVKTTPTDYTPASGEKLVLKSNLPQKQADTFPLAGSLDTRILEKRIDKLTRLVQQITETTNRTPLFAETSSEAGVTFPDIVANYHLAGNSAADDLEFVDPSAATTIAYSNHTEKFFSGDGTTVDFVLTTDPANKANIRISLGGVIQDGNQFSYTVATKTITFTVAPYTGTNNIYVVYGQAVA